jgi:2'-5' RNA ligase
VLPFFDRPDTRWRLPRECLHVYAIPPRAAVVRREFEAIASALSGIPSLACQPTRYMHATVQRLDAFESEVHVESLADRLELAVAAHVPFELEFAPPTAGTHAVEVIGTAGFEWRSLTTAVRGAITDAGLASTLTPPPDAPHYSVAYCRSVVDDQEVTRALAAVERPSTFTVESLALVSVDKDVEAGGVRFRVLRELPLRR